MKISKHGTAGISKNETGQHNRPVINIYNIVIGVRKIKTTINKKIIYIYIVHTYSTFVNNQCSLEVMQVTN